MVACLFAHQTQRINGECNSQNSSFRPPTLLFSNRPFLASKRKKRAKKGIGRVEKCVDGKEDDN
jgi:hypothetical protein